MRGWSDPNLAAVLFSPVRFLSMDHRRTPGQLEPQLEELIRMLQELLVIR